MGFSDTIPGTAGKPGPKTWPRHPGDVPLSESGREYLKRLQRETDTSIRLDLAMYGEVRRWRWSTMPETKVHQMTLFGEKLLRRRSESPGP